MPTVLVIPSGDAAAAGVALPTYRDRLADELGFRLATTISAAATSGEARRVALADDFRDDERGATLMDGDDVYLYVLSGAQAGQQSRVLREDGTGYQGSRSAVVLARPFAVALQSGTEVLLTGPLPVKRYLAVKGLDECINEALFRLPAVARLTFVGTGSNRFALASYPWLISEDQILGYADRTGVDATLAAPMVARPDARIITDAVTRYLTFGRTYATTETLEVTVSLPADRLIQTATAGWGYPATPGLRLDTDRAAVPEHWVLAFGMVMALRFWERHTTNRRDLDRDAKRDMVGELASRRSHWAGVCRALYEDELPRRTDPNALPLVGVRSYDGFAEQLGVPPWGWA